MIRYTIQRGRGLAGVMVSTMHAIPEVPGMDGLAGLVRPSVTVLLWVFYLFLSCLVCLFGGHPDIHRAYYKERRQ